MKIHWPGAGPHSWSYAQRQVRRLRAEIPHLYGWVGEQAVSALRAWERVLQETPEPFREVKRRYDVVSPAVYWDLSPQEKAKARERLAVCLRETDPQVYWKFGVWKKRYDWIDWRQARVHQTPSP